MSKIERLQDNNQPHMALQLIDKLLKDHPENGWLVTQRAMALFADGEHKKAQGELVSFLRTDENHPLANALLAVAVVETEPFDRAKKVIHRAFLKSMSSEPQIVGYLAGCLVNHFLQERKQMAARQHLAIVMRLHSDPERQQQAMEAMLEIDSDTSVSYPLRGGHPLPKFEAIEASAKAYKKAQRLYMNGCFAEAADVLDSIKDEHPESGELHHTIGLLRAWDGDEKTAAEELHAAAELYADEEIAIDLETMAQLLDRRDPDNVEMTSIKKYNIGSLSQLLSRLDNVDQMCRQKPIGVTAQYAGNYLLLDRDLPLESELESLTLESAPKLIGDLILTDGFEHEEESIPPRAFLTGASGDRFEDAVALFESAAGDLATLAEDDDDESELPSDIPIDEAVLVDAAFFPPKTPAKTRIELQSNFVERCQNEIWLNSPQRALSGKSPQQAADDESLRTKLIAAIRVFDAFMDSRNIIIDNNAMAQKLGVTLPEQVTATEDAELNELTITQLQNLNLSEMSDELFYKVMQRALVVKHCGQGYRVLEEFVTRRPKLVEEYGQESQQAYATLAEICKNSLQHDQALDWVQKGFEQAKDQDRTFENQMMWKMREVSHRAHDPQSPELKELLLELWNHYGAKLPVVREHLAEFVQVAEIDPPWDTAIVTPGDANRGEGIWTGDSEQEPSGEKKLWLGD